MRRSSRLLRPPGDRSPEGRTRGARAGVSSTRAAASARSKHPKGFVISQPPRVSRRRGVKLCVEYATRPDASAAGAVVRRRRPRRIGVGARVEFAARLAAPPPRPERDEAARRTRAEFVSTNHRIVKEAAGRRASPSARPWRLARGRSRPQTAPPRAQEARVGRETPTRPVLQGRAASCPIDRAGTPEEGGGREAGASPAGRKTLTAGGPDCKRRVDSSRRRSCVSLQA